MILNHQSYSHVTLLIYSLMYSYDTTFMLMYDTLYGKGSIPRDIMYTTYELLFVSPPFPPPDRHAIYHI